MKHMEWICALLLIAPFAGAQVPVIQGPGGTLSGLTKPYQPKVVPPINLSNSGRLEQLLRAGNIYLSLQDCIALALENNLDIEIQRYVRPMAEANLLRAQAGGLLRGVPLSTQTTTTNILSLITGGTGGGNGFSGIGGGGAGGTIITATGTSIPNLDPTFYVAGQFGHQTSPQTNSFVTGTNSLVYSNRSWVSGVQKGFLTGTNVSLNWQANSTQSNSFRNDFNPSTSGNMGLTITQHLLQGFGLAVNNRNIRIAKNNQRVSDLAFKQQVMQTVAAIIAAYWDLVSFNENVKVKEQALALSQRLYEDNKKQVEIGTLAPIEVVRAEAEVASNQQQLVNAQTQVLQQETALKNALSRTGVASPSISEAHIVPTDRITVPAQEPAIPVQDLVAKALDSRPELAQTRINIDNANIGLKGDKSELLPALDIQANLVNNGLAGQINALPIPNIPGVLPRTGINDPFFVGGFGRAISQIFSRNFPNYSVAFQLTVPIRNRSAQADMILDELNLRQAQLQEQSLVNRIRVDVRNALIGMQQASAAYQAAVKARELAEQTLEAEQKKYALGASTIFFVIQYQRDLAQARSNEVAAESAYAKSKVQLDLATGDTLVANNISIDEAWKGKVAASPSTVPAVNQKP